MEKTNSKRIIAIFSLLLLIGMIYFNNDSDSSIKEVIADENGFTLEIIADDVIDIHALVTYTGEQDITIFCDRIPVGFGLYDVSKDFTGGHGVVPEEIIATFRPGGTIRTDMGNDFRDGKTGAKMIIQSGGNYIITARFSYFLIAWQRAIPRESYVIFDTIEITVK
ncbi:MAG: hypothetical protein FWF83_08145 [Clostridiales bacterium]|nr:hypothetical protein [Clostridiales bacterium]